MNELAQIRIRNTHIQLLRILLLFGHHPVTFKCYLTYSMLKNLRLMQCTRNIYPLCIMGQEMRFKKNITQNVKGFISDMNKVKVNSKSIYAFISKLHVLIIPSDL